MEYKNHILRHYYIAMLYCQKKVIGLKACVIGWTEFIQDPNYFQRWWKLFIAFVEESRCRWLDWPPKKMWSLVAKRPDNLLILAMGDEFAQIIRPWVMNLRADYPVINFGRAERRRPTWSPTVWPELIELSQIKPTPPPPAQSVSKSILTFLLVLIDSGQILCETVNCWWCILKTIFTVAENFHFQRVVISISWLCLWQRQLVRTHNVGQLKRSWKCKFFSFKQVSNIQR